MASTSIHYHTPTQHQHSNQWTMYEREHGSFDTLGTHETEKLKNTPRRIEPSSAQSFPPVESKYHVAFQFLGREVERLRLCLGMSRCSWGVLLATFGFGGRLRFHISHRSPMLYGVPAHTCTLLWC